MPRFSDRMAFYTVGKVGKTREVTPEGFLLCRGVAIARTGTQLYSTAEVPIEGNGAGEVRIDRPPEEVFREETIKSFEGKPVTVEHPNDFVTPENWNQLSVGIVQNVRRGTGIEDHLMVADLLITAADAIEYVNKELPELSAGYEAEYEQTEPGRGVQRNIVGNHVALVERGRAGPRCAIQDKEPEMAKKENKVSFIDKLRAFLDTEAASEEKKTDDEESEEEEEKEDKKTTDAIASLTATVDSLAKVVAKLVKDADENPVKKVDDDDEEDDEEKEKTDDSVIEPETTPKADDGTTYTGDKLSEVFSRAEVLAPGIAIPTGDAAKAKDAAAVVMRKALDVAYATADGKKHIDVFLMGRDLKKLTVDSLAGVFNGAAELARISNNNVALRAKSATKDFGKPTTVASINAANKAFWATKAQ